MRLFTAIELPEDVRTKLLEIAPKAHGIRQVKPNQLHLTLNFIGNLAEEKLPELLEKLGRVHFSAFAMQIDGTGVFTKRKPKVVWAGVNASDELFRLQQELKDIIISCGIQQETRPFSPHITLSRAKPFADTEIITEFLEKNEKLTLPRFQVDSVTLWESVIDNNGAHHKMVKQLKAGGC